MKPGKLNVRPDHLSRIETREESKNIKDNLPDVQLFTIRFEDVHFAYIIQFFPIEMAPVKYTMKQKKELLVR